MAVAVIIPAVAAVGCSQSADKKPAARAADDTPYRFESEGQVPPPTSMPRDVDRVDVFEETPVAEGALVLEGVETVEDVPVVDDIVDSMAVTGSGYRVQVFATGGRENAENFEMKIEMQLGVPAYIEYVDGIYKVRVGDCRSRQQAESLRQRCRSAGYADAWIVATEIRWTRPATGGSANNP